MYFYTSSPGATLRLENNQKYNFCKSIKSTYTLYNNLETSRNNFQTLL